jgi:FkbM family methyltransferase
MRYKIKNTLIANGWFEDKILATLALYEAGKDISESPLIGYYREWKDVWPRIKSIGRTDLEQCWKECQEDFIALYESIKKDGYNDSVFLCNFDTEGRLQLYDGFHRHAILNYLGIETDLNVETEWTGLNGQTSNDFPLRKMLTVPPNRVRVYQPIDDTRVKDIPVERKDSQERLEWIREHLTKGTVLDIGCSEGYFTRALLRDGYAVTSVDIDANLIAVARYLTTTANLRGDFQCMKWQDFITSSGHFDNILYLSVLHNEINAMGEKKALELLRLMRGKANKLFMEIPSIGVQPDWGFAFTPAEVIPKLEDALEMDVEELYDGWRPLYLFTSSVKVHPSAPLDKNVVVEDVLGKYTLHFAANDHYIAPALKQHGVWERNTTAFIQEHLKQDQTFIDVGANVGYFTVLASECVGKGGRVLAFEPESKNRDLLTRNLALNKCTNVKVSPLALSDKNEDTVLYLNKDAGGHSLVEDGHKGTEPVTTMRGDEAFGLIPDMIKIDVEGAERKVLEGMSKTLRTPKTLTVIFEDWGDEEGIAEWLASEYGFCMVMKSHADGTIAMVKNAPDVVRHKEQIVCHLVGNVDIPTIGGGMDAFGTKVAYFGQMLKDMGHHVLFYGVEGSEVPCDEFIPVLDTWKLKEAYGEDWRSGHKMKRYDKIHNLFSKNAAREIRKRQHKADLLLLSAGLNHQKIAQRAEVSLVVEIGIGYVGSFAPYRVYESYAWMHFTHGKQGMDDGRFSDCVIPAFFDPADFTYCEEKEDYYLYMGRIIHRKGVKIAIDTVEAIGGKLKLAGPLSEPVDISSPVVEHLGVVTGEEKRELLSKAKAVFMPTQYLEPFGYVAIEAALSGTPVISTDFGSFSEIVRHGVTGYRCRTFEQFIWAARNIERIKPKDCRDWGLNFSLEATASRYEEYFKQLLDLYGKGWYTTRPDRTDLSGVGFPSDQSLVSKRWHNGE